MGRLINESAPVKVEVRSSFKDSKLANILALVQEATQRKAPTQRFMTKFAKVYTPIVVWLAVALTFYHTFLWMHTNFKSGSIKH